MSYPKVKIFNSTNFIASGKAHYMSIFCSDDSYVVTPGTGWEADSRGVCLLTKITATVKTPEREVVAKPYTYTETTYSNFHVNQTGAKSCAVTRIDTLSEDPIPEDSAAPTEQQK